MPVREEKKDKLKEITDKLEQGVKEVFESDRYREYLTCMTKFHNYSTGNTILICMQYPQATLVAGYKAWQQKHGRSVRRGEKGIQIIAPYKFKVKTDELDENGKEKEVERTGFRVAYVWDISQTEGRELPTLGVDELTGDVDGYKKLFAALDRNSPVPVYVSEISGTAKGYYDDAAGKIVIREGMSQLQTIKTLVHEMSHAKLHARDVEGSENIDRRTKECEAESIAFVVCDHFGLDTSDYTFSYVAGWSSGKDVPELKASLDRIRETADEIIRSVDKDLKKEYSMERSDDARDGKVAER